MGTASFAFGSEQEAKEGAKQVAIDIDHWVKDENDVPVMRTEHFQLADDVTGVEVLEVLAGGGSARSAALFLRRIVRSDDWERFSQATKAATPKQLGELVGKLIDEYSGFPTTPEAESSSG